MKTKKVMYEGKMVETIDITPTWEAVVYISMGCIMNPKAPASAKRDCWNELLRLARWVDKHNKHDCSKVKH